MNSHQPVGTELGLSRNSVSKLGTVRSTVGQRVDDDSVSIRRRYGPTASLIAESETSVDWNHKCHKFVNFYNNGEYGNIHHVNWLVQSVLIQGI